MARWPEIRRRQRASRPGRALFDPGRQLRQSCDAPDDERIDLRILSPWQPVECRSWRKSGGMGEFGSNQGRHWVAAGSGSGCAIVAVAPNRVEVVYEPNLIPPARYIADHDGPEDRARSETDQGGGWRSWLSRRAVRRAARGEVRTARDSPKLKWLHGTSAGMGQPATRLGLIDTDVVVTTASGVHAGALSEFVFAALLSHTRCSIARSVAAGSPLAAVHRRRAGRQDDDDHWAGPDRAADRQVRAGVRHAGDRAGRTGGPERATELGVDGYLPIARCGTAFVQPMSS